MNAYLLLVVSAVAGSLIGAMANLYPGLIPFAWTPVWAVYSVWVYFLRRAKTQLPPPKQFEQEFRDLLEKEGKS